MQRRVFRRFRLLQELPHLLRLMLHTILSVFSLRDQRVQLIQMRSHLMTEIDFFRLDAAVRRIVRSIRGNVIRRFHRHHLICCGSWLLLDLLINVGIRLLVLVMRRTTARAHLHFEQRSQTAANCLQNFSISGKNSFFIWCAGI